MGLIVSGINNQTCQNTKYQEIKINDFPNITKSKSDSLSKYWQAE